MDYAYLVGIVISVLGVAIAVIKVTKYKTMVKKGQDVMEFVKDKLADNKLTGKEIVAIITKIIDQF